VNLLSCRSLTCILAGVLALGLAYLLAYSVPPRLAASGTVGHWRYLIANEDSFRPIDLWIRPSGEYALSSLVNLRSGRDDRVGDRLAVVHQRGLVWISSDRLRLQPQWEERSVNGVLVANDMPPLDEEATYLQVGDRLWKSGVWTCSTPPSEGVTGPWTSYFRVHQIDHARYDRLEFGVDGTVGAKGSIDGITFSPEELNITRRWSQEGDQVTVCTKLVDSVEQLGCTTYQRIGTHLVLLSAAFHRVVGNEPFPDWTGWY